MPTLKATGPSVAVIHFNPRRTARLRGDEVDHLTYHITRLLTGEGTASSEWAHLGLHVELEADTDGGTER